MNFETETYILLLLSDSNLPTGSFVASSGLESYITHGFEYSSSDMQQPLPSQQDVKVNTIINFVRDSLQTYARSSLPFVSDTHRLVHDFHASLDTGANLDANIHSVLSALQELDDFYETTTLNHVTRRASKSQGVALLALYSRGFSRPPCLHIPPTWRERRIARLIDTLKLKIRNEQSHGHLAICWGVLCAALELTLDRTQYLHLFLHARSLLSASVRLNAVGPYGAQQILFHPVKSLVQAEMARCKNLRTESTSAYPSAGAGDCSDMINGPSSTWPLGEILAARHDLQHSRIFNS